MTSGVGWFDWALDGKIDSADENGCYPWIAAKNKQGYGILRWGRTRLAHRLVYEHEFGPIPPWLMVCHKCNNPSCVNPNHLYLGTRADNMEDMAEAGSCKGERHSQARLTRGKVRNIRKRLLAGQSVTSIALAYGVSRGAIYDIAQGKTWGWLK